FQVERRPHGVGDPLLNLARGLRDHAPVCERERERHLRRLAFDLELDASPRLVHLDALDALGCGRHDLRDDAVRDDERTAVARELDAHAAPNARSESPASSRKLVEYSPRRNASLSRISIATSRVVGTPRTSSSRSVRTARTIADR